MLLSMHPAVLLLRVVLPSDLCCQALLPLATLRSRRGCRSRWC